MVTSKAPPFSRIVRDPSVLEGEPIVAGTRIPVRSIVLAWEQYGTDARVLQAYPRLTRADLREALAYYTAHKAEIDRFVAEEDDGDEVESESSEPAHTHRRREQPAAP
ncbi:MAG: DUF433 domain-containing protein [Chloroflexi bacterium]|nr:DUF433 domain-containing protein [Chloroflexota bacterium]